MDELEKYYNKFNEDKRLLSRHGQVEYFVAKHYIDKVINGRNNLSILDVGAGTGRYSLALCEEGHNVYAIDYVQKNVSQIKMKSDKIVAKRGTAVNLKFEDNMFDVVLLFGPLYHLFDEKDKLKAILEAKRVVKPGGYILIMYLTNEYAVVTYALKEGHLLECINNGKLDKNFRVKNEKTDLYDYTTLDDIDALNKKAGLTREFVVGVDGPTDYLRNVINGLSEEEFELYKNYVLSISNRLDLIGASSHILDVLKLN